MTISISSLGSGGLIANYYCESSCRHCLYRSGPRWPRDYATYEEALEDFAIMATLDSPSIHVSGGEPLLDPDGLCGVLDAARDAGVPVQYVETGASWYRDMDSACALLEKLGSHGLHTLLISMSPFHNEFIPFSKTRGVIEACHRSGISLFPWIADFYLDLSTFDEDRPHSLEEYGRHFGEEYLEDLPRRYGIVPGGRALDYFQTLAREQSIEELAEEKRDGCSELGDTNHFHIDLYGNYIPGMCAGLSIAKEDLGHPLDPDEYPLITRLAEGGIGALLPWLTERYGFKPSRKTYTTDCQLCYEMRRFLVVERDVRSRELQPRNHYFL
ncbi:MAG: hypothetical protein AVO39_07800 [delta proteobacterium MLS_D]|nr:MAG: hypothetical protein AVO39_07800 [delta proteobacterium MLS_D]